MDQSMLPMLVVLLWVHGLHMQGRNIVDEETGIGPITAKLDLSLRPLLIPQCCEIKMYPRRRHSGRPKCMAKYATFMATRSLKRESHSVEVTGGSSLSPLRVQCVNHCL